MNDEVRADLEPIAADPALSLTPPAAAALPATTAAPPHWLFALLQSIAVCGIPTQVLVFGSMVLARGLPVNADGSLDLSFTTKLEFLAILSFIDTALIAILIRIFLMASKENSRDVYLGRRPSLREVGRGLALVPVTFLVVVVLVSAVRAIAPWLHNVKVSPLEAFMRNPLDAAIFLVVVMLAGGVREELQRGFILHRFGQRLGGMWVGNLTFGLAFGLLHFDQGWDIALVIGLLGLAWGALFIKRGSVLMPMANHAGFNAAQVMQQLIVTSMGIGK
jgi:membrane protease YdiL (CAAX protease family)